MKQIIKENRYVEVFYDTEIKLGMIVWQTNVIPSEEYRGAFEILIEYANENKHTDKRVVYFLSDTRLQGIVSPEDRKWFQQSAVPRAVETGLKKAGAIISGSVFKRYYMNMIIKSLAKFSLPFKVFTNETDALNWITSDNEHLEKI